MKILFVANRYPPAHGGSEIVEERLATGFVKAGHQVTVLTTSLKNSSGREIVDASQYSAEGVEVMRFKAWRFKKDPFTYSRAMFKWLLENRDQYDVVIAFAYGYATTWRLGLYKKFGKLRIPLVVQPHYAPNDNFPDLFLKIFDYTLGRILIRSADKIVLLTETYKQFFIGLGAKEGNLAVIPPIIPPIGSVMDAQVKAVKEKFNLPEGKIFLLSLSRLVEYKGVQFGIKALAAIRESDPELFSKLHFIISSDGEFRAELERLVIENDLKQEVTFTGYVTDEEKSVLYNISELFYLLSYSGESFGVVLVEAMSVGSPVVASNIGAIPAVVENGVTGKLVVPYEYQNIADATISILNDRSYSNRCIEAAKRYEGEKVIEDYIKLLATLI